MKEIVKCFNCGREKVDGLGKVIDGSWVDDWKVNGTEAWGKWVCSVRCYWDVVDAYGWRYVSGCDEVGE
jgi:hypothetical protein